MHPIQAFLHDIVETGQVTGAAALVRQGGKELFFGSAGLRDLTAGAPFSRDTVMRMFSMSKIVTAAAVLKLCEQNILAPETPVAAILPEYAHMNVLMPDGTLRPARTELTIQHLLTMTSGIPYPDAAPAPISQMYEKQLAALGDMRACGTRDFVRAIAQCPLCFEPGETWLYGLSADVLGGIIVAVTGMELGAFLKKTFFAPLGMVDTGFSLSEAQTARAATLYHYVADGSFAPRAEALGYGLDNSRVEMGGAGLFSTLDDFMVFGEMLRQDGAGILSPASIQRMRQNQLTENQLSTFWDAPHGYGFGYLVRTLMDESKNGQYRERVGSFGWNGMAGTTLRIDPARELTVVFGTQRVPSGSGQLLPQLMQAVDAALTPAARR